MDPAGNHSATPIALARDEGETLWFLGFLATIKASAETTRGRLAVIEQRAAQGAGSPLHVHHREGEWFYVLEGELAIWAGGQLVQRLGYIALYLSYAVPPLIGIACIVAIRRRMPGV